MRYRMDVGYDGRGFHGWAAQPGLRTVQDELQQWLGRVLKLDTPPILTCAGRTDAGVHARGQVAHFDLDGPSPESTCDLLRRRLPRALPEDLVMYAVTLAPPGFDARFSAIWRRYVYRLTWGPLDPLTRQATASVKRPLDLELMGQAGSRLIGLHDFTAFCKARAGATAIRNLESLGLNQHATGVVEIEVRADAFCHSMVRSLVGALVEVGEGRRDLDWIDALLTSHTRVGEIPVMPAHGLVLEEVGYPPDEELASRALTARSRRTLAEETS